MSVDETSSAAFCSLLQATPFLKSCYSKLNNCINMMEMKTSLAFFLDHLSIIENKQVCEAIQKHTFYCKSLESTEFLKSQGNQEDDKETETCLKLFAKNSFKDVWLTVARCDLNPKYQELPKKDMEDKQIFINNFRKIVTGHFLKSKREETVPVEMETELNDRLNQVATYLYTADSLIDTYKSYIKDLTLKKEEAPEVSHEDSQSFLEKAKLRQASLQQEVDQLSIQISTLFLENRERERLIQEETEKVVDEIEYEIQDFDENMDELQADLEAREAEVRKDDEELKKLGKLFEILKVEYNEIEERRRLAIKKTEEEVRILQLKTRAAIIAQAWWRGYSVRKATGEKSQSKKKK